MSSWKTIQNDQDIQALMAQYGGFHDACIVSATYQSGAAVRDDRSMTQGNVMEHVLLLRFGRQWEPRRLDLCFLGVRQLHLTGWQQNFFCDIQDVKLSLEYQLLPGSKFLVLWADRADFDISDLPGAPTEPGDSYVIAHALRWRIPEE